MATLFEAVAVYDYSATKTDELSFEEGDVIHVTRAMEGGWWEGELNGVTGWFPSNHCESVDTHGGGGGGGDGDGASASAAGGGGGGAVSAVASGLGISPLSAMPSLAKDKRASMFEYQSDAVEQLAATERAFLEDLHHYLQQYALPLQSVAWLDPHDQALLLAHVDVLIELHSRISAELGAAAALPQTERAAAVGALFLQLAEEYRETYTVYAADCARAIDALTRNAGNEKLIIFLQGTGVATQQSPTLSLVQYLNKPITRTMHYATTLKELARFAGSGDEDCELPLAQAQFAELSAHISDVRKRKDQEILLLASRVEGWEGVEMARLGELMMKSNVTMWRQKQLKERTLLLFESALVMLAKSPPKSKHDYVYKDRVPLEQVLAARRLDDNEHYSDALEVELDAEHRRRQPIVIAFAMPHEADTWVSVLMAQLNWYRAHLALAEGGGEKKKKGVFGKFGKKGSKEGKGGADVPVGVGGARVVTSNTRRFSGGNPSGDESGGSGAASNPTTMPSLAEKAAAWKRQKQQQAQQAEQHAQQEEDDAELDSSYAVPGYAHMVATMEALSQHVTLLSDELADVKAKLDMETERRRELEARLDTAAAEPSPPITGMRKPS